MKSHRTFQHVVIVLLLTVVSSFLPAQVLDRPVAIVRLTETVNIGQRQLRQDVEMIERQAGRALTTSERAELLEERINGVLLNQAASRANVRVSDEEIQQAIAAQRQSLGQPVSDRQFEQLVEEQMGLSWDTFVAEITNRLVQEKFVLERAQGQFDAIQEPSTEETRFVYETNAQEFFNPLMVRFEHLFFDVRGQSDAEAAELRRKAAGMARQLSRGTTDFRTLMRESLDDVSYAGGDFGYLVNGDQEAVQRLGRAFTEAVFRLDEDEVSSLIESNVGFHIVRVTDRRPPRLPGLNDPVLPGESITVRQQVRAFVMNRRQQEIFEETVSSVVAELRDEAEITRYRDRLDW
ncbi:MAG: peptidylprolyl isomerase [Spirochaeta sp.]|jgi:peptidyl-prolyl cis-trans isomerase SurA|nr:peptidylprolyl isomerase [Spirochaeta sp.]